MIRGLWAGLAHVFRYVAGGLAGVVYQLYIDDVGVARGDVPFFAEFASRKVVTSAQDVEVRMPVRGLHAPFDFSRRKATLDAATPPARPPEPPESKDKTIQSIGERLRITGKREGDEPGGLASQPVAYPSGEDGPAMGCTGQAEAVVTVFCRDSEAVGVLS